MESVSTRSVFFERLAELDKSFNRLQPELELTVRDPELDLEGYVVVHSTLAARGGPLGRCGKGGTRITPQVSLDEVKMLARIMTLKNAAAGLALGGAKSGLRADPDEPDFERKYRRFVSLVKPILVENGGIFGGFGFDIGGRPIHPIWACDEMKSRRGFTGKPLSMGGTDYDKEGIAGLGVATAGRTVLECDGKDLAETTFAVQGLGAMGAAVIRYFSEHGAKLSYVSDPRVGGTYRLPDGVTPQLLESISTHTFDKTAEILGSGKFEKLALDDVLYQDTDVLFPCAVQDVVNAKNCDRIRARYLVEGANNPCSEEARTALHARSVCVIPDFIANPGGIIAAFVEMTTENEGMKGSEKVERAKSFTRQRITENIQKLHGLVKRLDIEPAQAGRYMALVNIFEEGAKR